MMSEPHFDPILIDGERAWCCTKCGSIVLQASLNRHVGWHDALELSATPSGLVADVLTAFIPADDAAPTAAEPGDPVSHTCSAGLGGEQVAHNPVGGEPGDEPDEAWAERALGLFECDEDCSLAKPHEGLCLPAPSIPPTGSRSTFDLVPPDERAPLLLARVIEHADEMGDLANSTADDLRDALRLAAERLRSPAPSPVVEQPEPAGQSVPLSDLWLEVPAPVAWRHQTTSGGTAWDGWAATAVPNVAQVWRDQGFAVEPLYRAAPVLPPLQAQPADVPSPVSATDGQPDGTEPMVPLRVAQSWAKSIENKASYEAAVLGLAAAAVTHPHPTGKETDPDAMWGEGNWVRCSRCKSTHSVEFHNAAPLTVSRTTGDDRSTVNRLPPPTPTEDR